MVSTDDAEIAEVARAYAAESPFPAFNRKIAATQHTEQVTEQVMALMDCLQVKPLGARYAMQQLHLHNRPTFIQNYLRLAIHSAPVEMTEPNSPKSPRQKYRLTVRGKSVLQHQPRQDG